jgi:hypothetical protein
MSGLCYLCASKYYEGATISQLSELKQQLTAAALENHANAAQKQSMIHEVIDYLLAIV